MDDAFGELRSLLHAEPHARADAWDALTRLFEALSKRDRARTLTQWMPYANEVLDDAWDDADRVAPRAWVDACAKGQRKAALVALCRTLDMTGRREATLARICRADELEHIRRLEWRGGTFTSKHGKALRSSTSLANVDTLSIAGGTFTTHASKAINRAAFMPTLRRVSFSNTTLQPLALSMLRVGAAPSLESLTVESIRVSSTDTLDWDPLVEAELPALRHLSVARSWYLGDTLYGILGARSLGQLESLDLARAPERVAVYSAFAFDLGLEDPADVQTREYILEVFEVEETLRRSGAHPELVAKALASI
jgi:hypothetical protein